MSLITNELDQDDIDDWFKIGKSAGSKKPIVAVATSALRGHLFDSATGGTHVPDLQKRTDDKLPRYRKYALFSIVPHISTGAGAKAREAIRLSAIALNLSQLASKLLP